VTMPSLSLGRCLGDSMYRMMVAEYTKWPEERPTRTTSSFSEVSRVDPIAWTSQSRLNSC
jgi:hypothetical protein